MTEGPAGAASCSDSVDNDCDGLTDAADSDCAGGGGDDAVTSYGIIIGTVKDAAGSSLSDVTVTAGGQTASTNSQGWFSIDNISATSRLIVNFTKDEVIIEKPYYKICTYRNIYKVYKANNRQK